MSAVIAVPELITQAATDLATIGSTVDAAHMAAARTTSVIPAAADEVSASIAQVFSKHAANYQALAGKAAAFNAQFVQHLSAGAGAYTSAEGAIASLLQNWQYLNVNVDDLVSILPSAYLGYLNTIPGLPLQEQILWILNLPFVPLEVVFASALVYAVVTSLFP
jgi:hypothetical protein